MASCAAIPEQWVGSGREVRESQERAHLEHSLRPQGLESSVSLVQSQVVGHTQGLGQGVGEDKGQVDGELSPAPPGEEWQGHEHRLELEQDG